MNDELLKSLNIVKAKDEMKVAGVVPMLVRDLKILCEGYNAIDLFIRPCTDDEVMFDMGYDPDENITDELRDRMNRHEAIFGITKSLFHYLDIVKDDELTKMNGE